MGCTGRASLRTCIWELSPAKACPCCCHPHRWTKLDRHANSFFPLLLLCARQMWHEAPFCQGQHFAWTKQGGARVFTTGWRWEGWLAEGKRGEKSLCSFMIYICLSSSSSRQWLFSLCACAVLKTTAMTYYHNRGLNVKLEYGTYWTSLCSCKNHQWMYVQKDLCELGKYYASKKGPTENCALVESRIVAEPTHEARRKTKRLWELNKAHCFPSIRRFFFSFLFVSSGRHTNVRGSSQPQSCCRQSHWTEMKGMVMPHKQGQWQLLTSQ